MAGQDRTIAVAAERKATDRAQAEAADPAASAWVAANAGTGKTHVLTNRVLRLLVAGTAPERLLCLTYTKAAAAEMAKRVFDRLASWATADDGKLADELQKLLGAAATDDAMAQARELFAAAIETPGGLKIQTIHAFCEQLLQRFPLEAGVPPHFAILDEETGAALLREAIDEVLSEATRPGSRDLSDALTAVVGFAADDRFDEVLREAVGQRGWLEAASRLDLGAADTLAAAHTLLRQAIGIAPAATIAKLEQSLAAVLSDAELEHVARVSSEGSTNDVKVAERALAARRTVSPAQRILALTELFLTEANGPRKTLLTKKLATAHPDVAARLDRAQHRFVQIDQEHGHLALVEATTALLRLADAVMQRIADLKVRRAVLDFNDLIDKAAGLLSSSSATQWALYKLDGGLDHVLVDEAQDTSPIQWRVIESLALEFFSGSGAREDAVRTLFAVGDEKQSIYGFQGAEPRMFADMGQSFAGAAERAGCAWRRVPLTLSFRSTTAVLDAVDRVFAGPDTPGLTADGKAVRHAANRLGSAGLVEIWETEKAAQTEKDDVWDPADGTPGMTPAARLAARIADTVARWLTSGARLLSQDRPICAGDVLILVRKRNPFAPVMVNALKARGIPVAGADRIQLSEQIAVMDLVALARFVVLPEDDLSLAAVLKSPICGLDDNDLIALAPSRRGTLWSALLAAAPASARLATIADALKRWRAHADYTPPFEFFANLLDGDGIRTRLLSRLGPEAADSIDEFLSLTLAYDADAPPSLQGFLDWLERSERSVKRDMEQGRDEVRVMTVHGAKGLEAPIVFLPDTCTTASGARNGGLLALPDARRPERTPAPFLWAVKGSKRLAHVKAARAAQTARDTEERNRLLYVAMTRACDRLYVAGFEGIKGRTQGCWYDLVVNGLDAVLVDATDDDGRPVRRLQCPQEGPTRVPRGGGADVHAPAEPPDWARQPAPREPLLAIPLAPSRLAPLEVDAEGEPLEPTTRVTNASAGRTGAETAGATLPADGTLRFLRGTLTHALLQHLPTLQAASWEVAARRFVERRAAALPPRTRQSIVAETLAVLRDPAFAPLFLPPSQAEVSIVAELDPPDGHGQRVRVTGQIDRLVRQGHEVLIVDYKTNRPPPVALDRVPQAYVMQLAAYRLAVAQVFPGHTVRAALLWTDGARIMEIPSAMLEDGARRLFTASRANLDA